MDRVTQGMFSQEHDFFKDVSVSCSIHPSISSDQGPCLAHLWPGYWLQIYWTERFRKNVYIYTEYIDYVWGLVLGLLLLYNMHII